MSLSLGILLAASVAIDLTSLQPAARARVDADRLHGELLVRLTEQGYSARPPGLPTSYRIALRESSAETLVLEVSGAEQRSEELEVGASSVLHLAILQRAMILLVDLPPADTAPAHLASVHVRFRPRAGPDPDSRPYQRVAVMVVEDGFELVSQPDRAEWLVCATIDPGSASVWAGRGPAACEGPPDAVARSRGLDGDAFADRVAALARAALRGRDRADPSLLAEPTPDPPLRLQWTVATAGGGLARKSGVDPLVGVSTQLGLESGPGAVVAIRMLWSGDDDLSVRELMATAGPSWRVSTGLATWTAALTGGVLHHRYRFPLDSKARTAYTDWVVHASMDVALAIGRGWSVRAGGLAGRSAHTREHGLGVGATWRRGAHQLGLDAGLCFTF